MLISLILIALIAAGGTAITYLAVKDKPLLWRLSAGTVIGSAVFGLIAFVAACLIGFSIGTIIGSLVVSMLALIAFRRPAVRREFNTDWARAKGKLQGASLAKFWPFAYYAFFFILFWLFFDRTMFEMNGGIATGGSQNLGDLPYHLGAIFSFTEGNNFPPQNPSWAGAKFTYPFMADFLTACFVKVGADVRTAMFVQNVAWAFSLLVILERFVAGLTKSKMAGRIAPALLFLSGGLGFLWFLSDVSASGKGLWEVLWQLPRDYTIGDQFRWGNAMVVLFMTQRSLLLGMPITILVLGYLWKVFATENTEEDKENEKASVLRHFSLLPFFIGLLAGLLPLIHLHSLVVLFTVTGFLFVMRPARWREWIAFGAGVAVIAVPELLWSLSGSATETTKFFGFNWGWDKTDDDYFLWFWLKNTGLAIPLIIVGIFIYIYRGNGGTRETKKGKASPTTDHRPLSTAHFCLLLFYLPFAFIFLLANVAKLAPWEWDNIKLLIYWWLASTALVSLALAWAWEQGKGFRAAAALCFIALIAAGSLDVWRSVSGQIKYDVFNADAVRLAETLKRQTDPKALFLNAPTYNSAVVLTGRPSLMRYSGHLSSHGIDYTQREAEVKQIYQGGAVADVLLKKYNIDYVMVGHEERTALKANEEFFRRFPVVAESGPYRVYRVK